MLKLVVLCSLLAAALAEPGLAPYSYGSYFTPTTYATATGYSAPYLYGSSLTYGAPAHFIKKRSVAQVALPTTSYIASAYSSPLVYNYPSTYSSYPYLSSPYGYSHFIKKRSAPLALSTYLTPAAVSHQSRIDVHSSSPWVSYASPYLYSSPLGYSRYYK